MNASQYIASLQSQLAALAQADLLRVEALLLRARAEGRTIFILGNGGSAATASHMANDLNKGATVGDRPRFRALALTDNVPLITAWANDTHYGNVFVEQLANFFQPGDVVVAISGSGNSPNVLAAVEWAARRGAVTIGFTGGDGGQLRRLVACPVVVPSHKMEQIEDMHLILSHALCVSLRARIAAEAEPALAGQEA
ncbi:MAG: SIS domain-containing protein [Armatimonadota bacterium]|nr:SIS domain-containing protein [Armatimonadota bacterium]MDR7452266.1 SIS domain-containing protein [Armatimonadota bacterium]MDR7467970.1 SIS domain-containing protein [Armatimonadota bacterium]MDR7494812.1 SIS domain-containing protein [Armatimonadota bacterium]MDR7499234.1 SIS domain-containing protein [Armatimonadota bacterium]